jgi:hypothetical protein
LYYVLSFYCLILLHWIIPKWLPTCCFFLFFFSSANVVVIRSQKEKFTCDIATKNFDKYAIYISISRTKQEAAVYLNLFVFSFLSTLTLPGSSYFIKYDFLKFLDLWTTCEKKISRCDFSLWRRGDFGGYICIRVMIYWIHSGSKPDGFLEDHVYSVKKESG